MRQGKVFYRDYFAGILTETDDGEYQFAYDKEYISKFPEKPIFSFFRKSRKIY